MLFTNPQITDLMRGLASAPAELRTASIEVNCEPLALVQAGHSFFGHSTYFRTPAGDEVSSLGVAVRLGASGTDRFANLEAQLAALPDLATGTRLTLGFSFIADGPTDPEWSGFGACDAILPMVALVKSGADTRLVVAVPPGADAVATMDILSSLHRFDDPLPPDPGVHTVESVPSAVQWQSEVAEAVGAIRGGSLDKVVLARSVLVHSERPADPMALVHHLGLANPSSYIYAVLAGETAFVGASPELLLAQDDHQIRVNPLAGSARRGKGTDDVAVGEQLLASGKDRAEHAIVVDDLVARLEPLTATLSYPEGPSLRRMATVQHLSTDIQGSLRPGVSMFDVLASIHPTPAVGGTPRAEALAFIDKAEGIDRGWYSGGVGWIDPAGGAQVALALRCALVSGTTARLFAGNGIVAESDPAAELVETRLKFQPMLNLLAAT